MHWSRPTSVVQLMGVATLAFHAYCEAGILPSGYHYIDYSRVLTSAELTTGRRSCGSRIGDSDNSSSRSSNSSSGSTNGFTNNSNSRSSSTNNGSNSSRHDSTRSSNGSKQCPSAFSSSSGSRSSSRLMRL